MQCETVILPGS